MLLTDCPDTDASKFYLYRFDVYTDLPSVAPTQPNYLPSAFACEYTEWEDGFSCAA